MKAATPTPLRASPAILAEWSATVARAQRSSYPTLLVEPGLVLAIARELEILRSSNEFLRQREEKTDG